MKALTISLMIAGGLCCGTVAAGADLYAYRTLAGVLANTGSSADGTNLTARFYWPYGVTVDGAGNIYVADTYNCTIRKVWPSGTNWVTSTIAGAVNGLGWLDGTNLTAKFNLPYGIALDSAGSLYVADYGNHVIRRIKPVGTNWVVSTVAGSASTAGKRDGTNNYALFDSPYGMAVDRAGNLYVTDTGWSTATNTVRKVAPSGTNWVVTTLAGSTLGYRDGTNTAALFSAPASLAVDGATNIYVADAGNNRIRMVRPVGTNWVVTTLAGGGTGTSPDGTNTNARFTSPAGVAVDSSTNLYVTDTGYYTIRKIVPVGTNWVTSTIGGLLGTPGYSDGTNNFAQFDSSTAVAVDGDGMLYIADTDNSRIRLGVPWLTNAPTLNLARATNKLILSWSQTASGFFPKTRGSALTGSWSWVTGVPTVVGTRYYWTNTIGVVPAYYRLFNQ